MYQSAFFLPKLFHSNRLAKALQYIYVLSWDELRLILYVGVHGSGPTAGMYAREEG